MKLPEFGVNRPAATAMLFLAVLVLGIICTIEPHELGALLADRVGHDDESRA